MAMSPADVVVNAPPKTGHDREPTGAAVALLAVLVAAVAVLLVRWNDDGSPRRSTTATTLSSGSATTVTLRPAPPVLWLGSAQPDLAR